MITEHGQYKVVTLNPGEIHVASEPTIITTLLGSCVSVCLYSPGDLVGAMSHSVLPYPRYMPYRQDVRYVECAIDSMMKDMRTLGVQTDNIVAKLFGGAEMFHRGSEQVRFARLVGDGNADAARNCLGSWNVKVVSECVGGNAGRKLAFNTATGVVMVRRFSHGLAEKDMSAHGERVA